MKPSLNVNNREAVQSSGSESNRGVLCRTLQYAVKWTVKVLLKVYSTTFSFFIHLLFCHTLLISDHIMLHWKICYSHIAFVDKNLPLLLSRCTEEWVTIFIAQAVIEFYISEVCKWFVNTWSSVKRDFSFLFDIHAKSRRLLYLWYAPFPFPTVLLNIWTHGMPFHVWLNRFHYCILAWWISNLFCKPENVLFWWSEKRNVIFEIFHLLQSFEIKRTETKFLFLRWDPLNFALFTE